MRVALAYLAFLSSFFISAMESIPTFTLEHAVLNFWKTDASIARITSIIQMAQDLRTALGEASEQSHALRVHAAALHLNDLLNKEVDVSSEKRHARAIMQALSDLEDAAGTDVSDWVICEEAEERFAELLPA
jgi:hypothetical protein